MNCFCLLLIVLLLPLQRWTAQISGRILGSDGQPVAGAQITYKNVGIVDNSIASSPKIIEGTGRVYKTKTDEKGAFVLVGVDYGIYEVEVTGADGAKLYTGKKRIGDNADPNISNVLNVDLSTAPSAKENSKAAKINKLIVDCHAALDNKDWAGATGMLEQLIALDPDRWEFYQNLGTIQANLMHYEDAVKNFAKAVELAEKLLSNGSDVVKAQTDIGDLLLSEGDAYNRMGKLDEAVAAYTKAASISPKPATANYHACNALSNKGKTEEAIAACKLAITQDPSQWESYQLLGGAQDTVGKSQDAIETYQKGIEAARKLLQEKPDMLRAKTGIAQMLNSEGNILVEEKKYDDAIAVFTQAVDSSAYPAMPYFNLCATYYNLKRSREALVACDSAIQSDPTMADAYYVKGSVLFGQGKVVKGNYTAPAGTREALNKYLEYAPFGQHASTVRSMIDKLDWPVEEKYLPAKK